VAGVLAVGLVFRVPVVRGWREMVLAPVPNRRRVLSVRAVTVPGVTFILHVVPLRCDSMSVYPGGVYVKMPCV
jgi:hypothetical protein